MGNRNNLLSNVAGSLGGFVNGVLGGVVNTANSTVSSAATVVDGAIVGAGDITAKGAGLAVVGATSLVDIVCGYARGVFGTVGGLLNNTVIEVVKVVGGEEAAYGLPRDGNPKEHFGDLGSVIGAVIGEDGGLNGVRSSLAWSSKPVNWGGFNPFFGSVGGQSVSVMFADEETQATPLSSVADNLTQSIIAPLGKELTQPVNLLAGLLDHNDAVHNEADVAAFDNFLSPANDLLQDSANAVAVIM